ncbi:urease accessory protein UreD [Gluconacetobacter sp. Hr-1-5]|uniref:urease accessory protein UreD n=1 Tax=Gluconacetobacter sp. Hr-1-5 TaxID=3395370 RepID=UPI003B52CE4A
MQDRLLPEQNAHPFLQRAQGTFSIGVRNDTHGRTALNALRQQGCSRVLIPRRPPGTLEAILVNISGGIAAGDRLSGQITCDADSHLVITTQAAERFYRARKGEDAARIHVDCTLAPGARLDWLPHESIFFDNSAAHRTLAIRMAGSATALVSECRVFGRSASGERTEQLRLRDVIRIERDGIPVMIDAFLTEGPFDAALNRDSVAAGRTIMHTILYAAPDAASWLEPLRETCTSTSEDVECAVSAWNGLLVARILSARSRPATSLARRLLARLRPDSPEPATWRW